MWCARATYIQMNKKQINCGGPFWLYCILIKCIALTIISIFFFFQYFAMSQVQCLHKIVAFFCVSCYCANIFVWKNQKSSCNCMADSLSDAFNPFMNLNHWWRQFDIAVESFGAMCGHSKCKLANKFVVWSGTNFRGMNCSRSVFGKTGNFIDRFLWPLTLYIIFYLFLEPERLSLLRITLE